MASSPFRVAVCGAGISGAAAAARLAAIGCEVVVFDAGRQAGGRASTRRVRDVPGLQFDHGLQFIRPSQPAFASMVKEWEAAGVVAEWRGRVGRLDAATGAFAPRVPSPASSDSTGSGGFFDVLTPGPLYVGMPAADSIPQHLLTSSPAASSIKLVTGTRLQHARWQQQPAAPGGAAGGSRGVWQLQGAARSGGQKQQQQSGGSDGGDELGEFHALVVSDSLAGKQGSPMHLGVSGSSCLEAALTRAGALPRAPLFTLMLAFDRPLPLPFDAAAVEGGSAIAWVAVDSSKPGRATTSSNATQQRLVAVTTPQYAQQLLAAGGAGSSSADGSSSAPLPPQTPEYLAERAGKMWEALQQDLRSTLGEGQQLPAPSYMQLHRWGAAYTPPGALLGAPCLAPAAAGGAGDAAEGAAAPVWAVCGDFCQAPGVEGAVLSGMAAADAVVAALKGGA